VDGTVAVGERVATAVDVGIAVSVAVGAQLTITRIKLREK
jgi:hypothetical protein